jgi:HAD superfamily hydrolase (TIGR01450 family)
MTPWSGAVAAERHLSELGLHEARGFVFDVDGTLVHRRADGRAEPHAGAAEVLDAIRASGRRLVLFTNGSHMPSDAIAHHLRQDGLEIADDEVLTPVESGIGYLQRRHPGQPVMLFATDATRDRIAAAGIPVCDDEHARVVFVTHVDEVDLDTIERAARAVSNGAPLLAGSYARGYAGANGMIISRGAMVTAAIAKGGGRRPKIVGKPSHAALAQISARLGVPIREIAVIGDDAGMDIALGNLGGARTVLVRSGISGQVDLARLPAPSRPDAAVDHVSDLLELL